MKFSRRNGYMTALERSRRKRTGITPAVLTESSFIPQSGPPLTKDNIIDHIVEVANALDRARASEPSPIWIPVPGWLIPVLFDKRQFRRWRRKEKMAKGKI